MISLYETVQNRTEPYAPSQTVLSRSENRSVCQSAEQAGTGKSQF